MELPALLAIGSLALWMGVAIVGAQLLRRRRRRDMGLPPLQKLDVDLGGYEPATHPGTPGAGSRPAAEVSADLPHREKDWRNDPSVYWTTPRYYGGARRRLQEKETK